MRLFIASIVTIMALNIHANVIRRQQRNVPVFNIVFNGYVAKIAELQSIENENTNYTMQQIKKFHRALKTGARMQFHDTSIQLQNLYSMEESDQLSSNDKSSLCYNFSDLNLRIEYQDLKEMNFTSANIKYCHDQIPHVMAALKLAEENLKRVLDKVRVCYDDAKNIRWIAKTWDCIYEDSSRQLEEFSGFLQRYQDAIEEARLVRLDRLNPSKVCRPRHIEDATNKFFINSNAIKDELRQCIKYQDLTKIQNRLL